MNGIGVDGLDFQFVQDVCTEQQGCQFERCLELVGADAVAVDVADRSLKLDLGDGVERLPLGKDVAEDAVDGFDRSLLVGCEGIAVEDPRPADAHHVLFDVVGVVELGPPVGQNDGEKAGEILHPEHLFELSEASDDAASPLGDHEGDQQVELDDHQGQDHLPVGLKADDRIHLSRDLPGVLMDVGEVIVEGSPRIALLVLRFDRLFLPRFHLDLVPQFIELWGEDAPV